jgi:hypothetical protein
MTSDPMSFAMECVARARVDSNQLPYQQAMITLADEIDRLREIVRARGQHAESCDFHGECRCELQEFQL